MPWFPFKPSVVVRTRGYRCWCVAEIGFELAFTRLVISIHPSSSLLMVEWETLVADFGL
jgi:hypothetical protein